MSERVNPRLADHASPYLQEAATQPVDWHTLDDDPLEKARQEGKPVLVDSGAVWCHWCHVMDHESYEDPATAELINERFVPVKLDRDERPDVDRRLQQAVGALTGRGGWPLTAFLTPDGEVYFGGTYFPREAAGGMPAFTDVLQKAADIYEQDTEQAEQQAAKIREVLEQRSGAQPGEVDRTVVEQGVQSALSAYDPAHGGFGQQPKFPQATALTLLTEHARGTEPTGKGAWEALAHTMQAMREGGVWDHLGGGFHRYSTDEAWHVPHFEKMLYDQAQLAAAYAVAGRRAQLLDDDRAPVLVDTARRTRGFVREVLEREEGGFGGSMDADRRPEAEGPVDREDMEEGDYFTWTLEEVREVLDDEDEVKLARLAYGIEERGDMDHAPDRNVLHQVSSPENIAEGTGRSPDEVREELADIRSRLLEARRERRRPPIDPTVYADWNGLAVEGLLLLDDMHGDEEAREAALGALDRLLEEAFEPEDGFAHALSEDGARVWGLAEDQTHGLAGLLAAFRTTQDETYLEAARQVGDVLVDDFTRDDGLVRFNREEEDPAPRGDQPTPAPAAQAALHLPRLANLTGEERYREVADEILEAIAGRADDLGGLHGATLMRAIAARVDEPPHVIVTGDPAEADPLSARARQAPIPQLTLVHAEHPDHDAVPEQARQAAGTFADEAVAIVCQDGACQVAQTPAELTAMLHED